MGIPSLALTAIVIVWSCAIGVAIYRILGVTISNVGGQPGPATLWDEVLIHGVLGSFLAVLAHVVVVAVLFVGRVSYRWWRVALPLVLLGTPLSLFIGKRLADHLWSLNQGGTPWEGIAPQVIAIVFAWIVAAQSGILLSYYRRWKQRRAQQLNRIGGYPASW
jgi:hypothetical protein